MRPCRASNSVETYHNNDHSKRTDMKSYYSLLPLGIDAYAFSKQQALNIISRLRKNHIPILGGDVYCFNNGLITDSCDSWYCNLETGETQQQFVQRSCLVAEKYIESYPENNIVKNLFSIVTEIDILEYLE